MYGYEFQRGEIVWVLFEDGDSPWMYKETLRYMKKQPGQGYITVLYLCGLHNKWQEEKVPESKTGSIRVNNREH